jgi:hypothetical protein
MIAARTGRQILGFDYDRFVMSMDWNRVLIEAQGMHLREHMGDSPLVPMPTCGTCLRNVLLMEEEW